MTSSQDRFINCPVVDAVPDMFRQTVQHLTSRIEEHNKADSPLRLHLQQCQLEGNSAALSREIIDTSNNQTNLLTLEEIHITKEKPGLNARDEFRSRE